MGFKNIVEQKNKLIEQVYKETQCKLYELFENEFSDFKVKIVCDMHHNEIQLEKNGHWVRYCLFSSPHKNWYLRKSNAGGGFTYTELKNIKEGLNNCIMENL